VLSDHDIHGGHDGSTIAVACLMNSYVWRSIGEDDTRGPCCACSVFSSGEREEYRVYLHRKEGRANSRQPGGQDWAESVASKPASPPPMLLLFPPIDLD